ncbi:RNA polymerase dimerization [Pyrolobus fumarii 1A]|uniref:DNA-directed RNA polymerase subunit Rpo11 n=1 Tax=Pyrolobus fumarii (strain DSM 11204 / 1A) TaxID=694429 RepID=G0EET7_PYRF1|nr:DNA-directed RNA polymerase subunit L [Pyrolobus fumarii]AEM38051.1 RNA polymerase dimerization [Pyrolobus fumarii 1A]
MARLELVKASEKRVEVRLRGEDHTMANLIVKLAIRKPHVTYAAYRIDHPLVDDPVVVIATDGTVSPIDVLENVLNEIVKLCDEFKEKFEKTASKG